MKRLLLLLFFVSFFIRGYTQTNVRHYEGVSASEINLSKTSIGTSLKIGYSRYLSDKIYIKSNLGYGSGRKHQILFREFSLDGLINYSVINLNGLVFINVSAGPVLLHERVKNIVPSINSKFVGGGKGGIEIEVPVYDGLLFIANGYQSYITGSELGKNRREFGLGIKVLIN